MIGSKPFAKLKSREVNGARMAYVDEGEGEIVSSMASRLRPTSGATSCRILMGSAGSSPAILSAWARRPSSRTPGRVATVRPSTPNIYLRCGMRSNWQTES